MRAALYDHNGPAREVLRVQDVERPEPGAGQVRVRVQASGVNPTDRPRPSSGITRREVDHVPSTQSNARCWPVVFGGNSGIRGPCHASGR
jgi:Zn-dependent alcohol dehydrogenase